MKKAVQLAAGSAVIFGAAPYLHGTPLYHWMIFVPLFAGTMYAVAVVQHWLHWRTARRSVSKFGVKARGTVATD